MQEAPNALFLLLPTSPSPRLFPSLFTISHLPRLNERRSVDEEISLRVYISHETGGKTSLCLYPFPLFISLCPFLPSSHPTDSADTTNNGRRLTKEQIDAKTLRQRRHLVARPQSDVEIRRAEADRMITLMSVR